MKNFEERLERLEELTRKMKAPETPLSQAIDQFEEGYKLACSLEKDLEKLEKRIEILLNPSTVFTARAETAQASFELFDEHF